MNRLDDEVAQSNNGYNPPRRVNLGWISESWQLFRAQADVWISVVAISVFAPAILDAFVAYAYSVSSKITGADPVAGWAMFSSLPNGLKIGLAILNIIYIVFVMSGIHTLALRQVAGNPVSFTDFYSGGSVFGRMLIFLVIYLVVVGVGLAMVILPGIFAAAMLLPAFALIADGESVGRAMSRSFQAMYYDRFSACTVAFLLLILIAPSVLPFFLLSTLPLVLTLMVTAPMVWLISALALRDMIGLRSRLAVVDIDFVPQDRRGQILAPEIDESVLNAAYAYGGAGNSAEEDSGPRLTLTGDAMDEHDASASESV